MRPRPLPRLLTRLLTVLVLAVGGSVGCAGLAGPASAADRVISIDRDGPEPATLTRVRIGDSIVFQNVDPTLPHTVRSTSSNWSFRATINPSTSFRVPGRLAAAGRYTYSDDSPLEDFAGEVRVAARATASPAPTRGPSRSPAPRPSSARPTTQPATPQPTATPGSGEAVTPPLVGGAPTPSPTAEVAGPPPVTAPPPTESEEPEGRNVALPGGTLPEPPTPREFGLPTALATVGAAGTASLLVRFLLAHPAGRRRPDGPVVTLDPTS